MSRKATDDVWASVSVRVSVWDSTETVRGADVRVLQHSVQSIESIESITGRAAGLGPLALPLGRRRAAWPWELLYCTATGTVPKVGPKPTPELSPHTQKWLRMPLDLSVCIRRIASATLLHPGFDLLLPHL